MTANDYLVGMHWHDVIVVGAGHNGLTAALLMARKGLKVIVIEATDAIGGAMRTERPFEKAPELALSTGASLVGLLPPDLLTKLGIDLPTVRRDPHAFVPTAGPAHVVFGTDLEHTGNLLTRFYSAEDARAYAAMVAELSSLRADLAPAWLAEPHSVEETAERYVRPALQRAFVAMCRGSAQAYVDRWGFASDRVRRAVAACDGAADAGWDEPGSGAALLLHHAATADGTWRVVQGGMGTVTRMIADQAVRLGAILETEARVSSIVVEHGVAKGVVLKDGTMHHATAILCSAEPHGLRELVGREKLSAEYNARLDARAEAGSVMKLHLALRSLPRFTSLPDAFEQGDFAPTIQLLPDDAAVAASASRAAVKAGTLPASPALAMHVHTGIDPSLRGEGRNHGATLEANVPYAIAGSSWDAELEGFVKHMVATVDRFAPGTGDLVVDALPLSPPAIERRFGARAGHALGDAFAFGDRMPFATGIQALYSCSAAAHPTGAVVGGAGHGAAMRVLRDLGKPLSVPPPR